MKVLTGLWKGSVGVSGVKDSQQAARQGLHVNMLKIKRLALKPKTQALNSP